MSQQPHILIDALNLARGGGVVVMTRLAEAFARVGWRVSVLASRPIFDKIDLPDGVTVAMYPEAAGALKSALFRGRKLDRIAQTLGGDLLLGFNYHSPVSLPQVTYHINIIPFLPWAARRHAVGLLRAVGQARAARRALKRSTLNLFESRYVQDLSGVTGADGAADRVAYIGIDRPPEGVQTCAEADRTLVCVTSGAPHKRNDQVLAAFARWVKTTPEARLVFVGAQQAIRASLPAETLADLETQGLVRFSGYLDRAGLYAQLRESFALITASELESFVMVALEAMAAGCPVVAAQATSAGESLGGAGILVAPGDVAAMAEALQELAQGDLRSGLVARGFARAARFDAVDCADGFVAKVEAALSISPARDG